MFSITIKFLVVFALALTGACSTVRSYTEPAKSGETFAISEADPELRSALEYIVKVPDSALGYQQLAVIYIKRARQTGDFSLNSKAETAIKKGLEAAPDDVSIQKLQASLHLTFHRFDEALALGTQLLRDNPNDAFVYGILTDANAELGNYDAAAIAVQKMVDLKPNSSSYARVAHIRSLNGEHAGAVEMFKLAARTADPQDKEAQSWCLVRLGDEFMKHGKYAAAEKVYDEALDNFPGFYLALAGTGKAKAAQGDLDGAVDILTSSQKRVPNAEVAKLLGDIHAKRGELDAAQNNYDLVEVMETKLGANADKRLVALTWADRNTRLEDAREIAERRLAQSDDIYTADIAAWCLYKTGRFAEAKVAIEKAMRLRSMDARILYHAGMIEKELGNRAEAIRLLGQALKINPEFDVLQSPIARETLTKLMRKV